LQKGTERDASERIGLLKETEMPQMSGQAKEPIMSHWHDTMVDRPEADGAVYVAGWTISGLAVLAVIFAVWVFAI
jgi:hypothetical protein